MKQNLLRKSFLLIFSWVICTFTHSVVYAQSVEELEKDYGELQTSLAKFYEKNEEQLSKEETEGIEYINSHILHLKSYIDVAGKAKDWNKKKLPKFHSKDSQRKEDFVQSFNAKLKIIRDKYKFSGAQDSYDKLVEQCQNLLGKIQSHYDNVLVKQFADRPDLQSLFWGKALLLRTTLQASHQGLIHDQIASAPLIVDGIEQHEFNQSIAIPLVPIKGQMVSSGSAYRILGSEDRQEDDYRVAELPPIDQDYLPEIVRQSMVDLADTHRSQVEGTTALVSVLHQDKLVVGNYGTSSVALFVYDKRSKSTSHTRLGYKHSTNDPFEEARLIESGQDLVGHRTGKLLRVPNTNKGLRVARVFGGQGITGVAPPDISELDLSGLDLENPDLEYYLYIGSGGVANGLKESEIAEYITHVKSKDANVVITAKNIVDLSAKNGSSGNMTVIFTKLEKSPSKDARPLLLAVFDGHSSTQEKNPFAGQETENVNGVSQNGAKTIAESMKHLIDQRNLEIQTGAAASASKKGSSHSSGASDDGDSDSFPMFGHDDEEEEDDDDASTEADEEPYQDDEDGDEDDKEDESNDEENKEVIPERLTFAKKIKQMNVFDEPSAILQLTSPVAIDLNQYELHLQSDILFNTREALAENLKSLKQAIQTNGDKTQKNLKKVKESIDKMKKECTQENLKDLIKMQQVQYNATGGLTPVVPIKIVKKDDDSSDDGFIKLEDLDQAGLGDFKQLCLEMVKDSFFDQTRRVTGEDDFNADINDEVLTGHNGRIARCAECTGVNGQQLDALLINVAKIADSVAEMSNADYDDKELDRRNHKRLKLSCMYEEFYRGCGDHEAELSELSEFREREKLGGCNQEMSVAAEKDQIHFKRIVKRSDEWLAFMKSLKLNAADFPGLDLGENFDYEKSLDAVLVEPDPDTDPYMLQTKLSNKKLDNINHLLELNKIREMEQENLEEDKYHRFEQKMLILKQFLPQGEKDKTYTDIQMILGKNKNDLRKNLAKAENNPGDLKKLKKAFFSLNAQVKDFEEHQKDGDLSGAVDTLNRLHEMKQEQQARKKRLEQIDSLENIILGRIREIDPDDSDIASREKVVEWQKIEEERVRKDNDRDTLNQERAEIEAQTLATLKARKAKDFHKHYAK